MDIYIYIFHITRKWCLGPTKQETRDRNLAGCGREMDCERVGFVCRFGGPTEGFSPRFGDDKGYAEGIRNNTKFPISSWK